MSVEIPAFEATPLVSCCFGAVVILLVFVGWLAIHAAPGESDSSTDRDDREDAA